MRSARSLLTTAILAALTWVGVACATRDDEPVEAHPEAAAPAPSPIVPPAGAIDPAPEPATPPPEDDDSPTLVAYPPPRIENVVVRRSGQEVRLVARVSRVRGASRYDLQVAKTLMFEPLLAEGSTSGRSVNVGPLPPGMFFVHARAVGAAGEGPFGDVRVVHAHKGGLAKLRPVTEEDAAEPMLAGLPPEKTAGATPAASAVLIATPEAKPNLARLGPLRQRYEQLQRELAEVEGLRREVEAKVAELRGRLAGAKAKSAATLQGDLEVLEATRTQLDREITAGLAELDRMLAASTP
ncbi:MAG: hypothetical protein ACAI38_21095 [Myxococcota bacterium]